MTEGESAKPAAHVDKLVQGLVDSFVASWGTREYSEATIRRYLPAWDGKYETIDDLTQLGHLIEKEFGKDTANIPKDVGNAIAGLLVASWSPKVVAAVSENFHGLDPVQALAKLWQVFSTSVDAKRKGGRSTKKWTPEVEEKARQILASEMKPKVSKDAAYRRTVARLKSEHGISISRSTLQRYLSQPNA